MNHVEKIENERKKNNIYFVAQDAVSDIFMALLEKKDKETFDNIKKYEEIRDKSANGKMTEEHAQEYRDLMDNMGEDSLKNFTMASAKLNNLKMRALKYATVEVLNANDASDKNNADKFDNVLRRLNEAGTKDEAVQKFIDENASAWFSLTAHPTNPHSVEYTKAAIDFENVFTDSNSTKEQLKDSMNKLLDTDIVEAKKKTPAQELEEAMAILDNVYDSVASVRNKLRKALDENGYENVEIPATIIRPNIWQLGDGDGNDKMTEEVLRDGIEKLREGIKEKYNKELDEIVGDLEGADHPKITTAIYDIKKRLNRGGYEKNPQEFTNALNTATEGLKGGHTEIEQKINDLAFNTEVFGLHYAKIDIRHNAVDIMETLGTMAEKKGIITKGVFDNLGVEEDDKKLLFNDLKKSEKDGTIDEKHQNALDGMRKGVLHAQKDRIEEWMNDPEHMKKLMEIDPKELDDGTNKGKKAARIFGRLKVVGENPDMSEKIITAETEHPAHALAALCCLKASGNEVANDKAKMHVVTLSESVKDLKELKGLLEELLKNDTYRKHIEKMGDEMIVQIAKSDTTRRGGFGATGSQEDAVIDILEIKAPDGKKIKVHLFFGGGHSLNRGGGKYSEMAHNIGLAAGRAENYEDFGSVLRTIQGHQMQKAFGNTDIAQNTLEADIAQGIFAPAQAIGIIPYPKDAKGVNERTAREDTHKFNDCSRKAFQDFKNMSAFNELLEEAPWIGTEVGNSGARTSKRGGGDGTVIGITPAEFLDTPMKALDQRAITADTIARHSGVQLFMMLGIVEGMQDALNSNSDIYQSKNDKEVSTIHNMHEGNKSVRDNMRALANVMNFTDFDHSWRMMIGEEKPEKKELEKLVGEDFLKTVKEITERIDKPSKHDEINIKKYFENENLPEDKDERRQVTLARLEYYTNVAAKMVNKAITGDTIKEMGDDFTHKNILKRTWPELSETMDKSLKEVEGLKVMEAHQNRKFQEGGDLRDTKFTENIILTTKAIGSGIAGAINTPVNIIATGTRKNDKGTAKSYTAKIEEGNMKLPRAVNDLYKDLGVQSIGR